MADAESDGGFLSRWSQRKAKARRTSAIADPAAPPPVTGDAPALEPSDRASPPARPINAQSSVPPPTLAEAAHLTRESDFTRFVADGVESDVKNAALKKLFSDPQFNVMDGLDVYIDDYSRPDPLPHGMLLKMAQAKFLGLLTQETGEPAAGRTDSSNRGTIESEPATADVNARTAEKIAPDEDVDMQLQPHDAAGRAGAEPGPGEDGGCKH